MATLLTGAGYIGAALLQQLAPSAAPVVALENFFSTRRGSVESALAANVRLVEGDVAEAKDLERAFDALGSDHEITVFHLAAQPSASVAARDPEVTERSNLTGARVLLEAAYERRAKVVFGGSFRVYGDDLAAQCVDEDTPYGRVGDLSHLSKIYVEQLGRMLGGAFISVRLGVTYGVSPVMKTEPAFMTVPNLFCWRAAHGQSLRVLEDRPMGFIHVQDAARALLDAADQFGNGWHVVNAAPEVATIGHVARTVARLAAARRIEVCIEGASALDVSEPFEVRSRLRMEPRWSLERGLGDVLDTFGATP